MVQEEARKQYEIWTEYGIFRANVVDTEIYATHIKLIGSINGQGSKSLYIIPMYKIQYIKETVA